MAGVSRRGLGVDVAAAVYAAAFYVWLVLRPAGTPLTQFIGIAAFWPLGLAAAWAYWHNTRLPGLDTRTRVAWHLLAVSALLLFTSGSAWDLYVRLVGGNAWPAWMDQVELTHHLAVIAAILVFPGRRLAGRSRTRFLLDVGLMFIAGFVLALYFGLRLWFKELQGESIVQAIMGPGVDWVVFVTAAAGSISKRDRATRLALVWLAVGATVYLVANYYFTIDAFGAAGFTYRPGDTVDGLWFGAWACRWVAARLAHVHYRHAASPSPPTETGWVGYERSGFSYLVVAATCITLTSQAATGDPTYLGVLAFSVALVVGLLLARQMMELHENRRLFDERLLQEARFRSLVQHSSDVVLVVDAGGRISYASPAAARTLGDGSPVRAGASLLDLARGEDRPALEAMLSGTRGSGRLQLHLPGAAGWRDMEALWNDLRSDRAVGGIVVNCRDVTERNELERQLRHSQKLDAVGHLAGGLAHDLNNVLAIVSGYADLLRESVHPGSAAADDLAHVQQAVGRAATITGKLLAFSRRQPVLRTVVDLNGLVHDLLPLLQQAVKAKVEVVFSPGAALWGVSVDRGQMEQVLLNLATNARDAMPGGGVLEITTRNVPAASVPSGPGGAAPPGDRVSVVVKDTGSGMTEEVRTRIFEPFFSTKAANAGMGLGLAMVHGIISDSGGRILVDSSPGRGTAFTILLPRSDAPQAVEEAREDSVERGAPTRTVLLVDDESHVRVVARRMLQRQGYRVIEAANGQAALDVLTDRGAVVDVLVTDLVMPGMHGRELIAQTAKLRPSLPVVCITGFAGEGDDRHQYGSQLVALLIKPFTAEALSRAVRDAVSRGSVA